MVRWISAALVLLCSACSEPPPTPESAVAQPQRRGLWVLAEGTHRTLEDPTKVARLLDDAAALGVTDLFVQVYRGGRSWYPSNRADDTPYRNMLAAQNGDSLASLLAGAHERDLRVHAWFNALSLAQNREAPLLVELGRDAVLVDRDGRNLLDYPDLEVPAAERPFRRMGTPGVWLDPATPGVIEYLEATVDDLVAAAPELDGLHLDFIRHPMVLPLVPGSRFDVGMDFGYGEPAVRHYEAETGHKLRRGDAWDAFRREQVSAVVRRLHARLPPHWELSAATVAYAERAYLTAMQDWRAWLEAGDLDFAVAMAYTRDDALLRYLAHSLVGGVAGEHVWLGLGTWLFVRDPVRARTQLDLALAPGPSGVVLFSYDALVAAPDAMAALTPERP
jgi:uncharacterized lipoprotein YddW (UPF0748 family)